MNEEERNASLTTRALDKEDPDKIRGKGQTFEPEYNSWKWTKVGCPNAIWTQ